MLSLSFFLAIALGLTLLPWTWRISISIWASVLQFYTFPIFGVYPSIALISHLSLSTLLVQIKRSLSEPLILTILAILATQAISLYWSPDKVFGVSKIVHELPFLMTLWIGLELARTNRKQVFLICKIYAVITLVPIALLLAMRIHFNLDSSYLESPLASLFIDPNLLHQYPYTQNTLRPLSTVAHDYLNMPLYFGTWLDKPHSIFLDPDVCASYFGVCGLLLWGIGHYGQSRFLKIMGAINWIASFFIFSRLANILGLSIPLFIGLIHLFDHESSLRDFSPKKAIAMSSCFGLLIALLSFIKGEERLDNFFNAIFKQLDTLNAALMMLKDDLLFGLGFGGWPYNFQLFDPASIPNALDAHHPPDNSLLQLLSESGIVALTIGLIFIGSIFFICYASYRRLENSVDKLVCLCISGALFWVFIEGMSENTGIFGDVHTQPILALGLALLLAMRPKDYERDYRE